MALFVCGALGLVGCRKDASATTAPDDGTATAEPTGESPPAEAKTEHAWVDVDLAPHGIGATIHGPDGAKVFAKDNYVEVEAGEDFHMQVHRGEPNMLEEKADIVRRHGPDFRRFVRDDTKTVIWETGLASNSRFHFFATGKVQGLSYYCNTVTFGVSSLDAIERMMQGCHELTVHDHVGEPKKATPTGEAKPAG
ncbi:MAG: hypothetical protein IAG13_04085 [Deltaproteobacteria bacterium]|nr:hypothetical protein [Nannocystaceae bacterium]